VESELRCCQPFHKLFYWSNPKIWARKRWRSERKDASRLRPHQRRDTPDGRSKGAEEEVLKELRKVMNVKEAYVVYGVYDIVARVEAETMDKLKEVVTWKWTRS
jgi:DNA-binding Lrp family transcriptional regulator